MLYHNVQVTAHSLRFVDTMVLSAAAVGTWSIGYPRHGWPPSSAEILAFYVAINAIAFLALGLRLHVYQARRTEKVASEFFLLLEAAVYSSALACLATQVFTRGTSGRAYIAMLGVGLMALLGLRLVMRIVIRRLRRRGGDQRCWLIIGHNNRAAEIANEILRNPQYGIRIEEIADIADASGAESSQRRQFAADPPVGVRLTVIDDIRRLRDIMSERVLDEVVVTLPVRSHYDTVSRILDICAEAGISVRLRPEVFDAAGYATTVSYVGNIPMVAHYNGPANYGHLLVKRVIDVLGAGAALTVLAPCFAALAIAIKWDSPGPVLFRQTRVGLHGRHFEMIKFRSMVTNAHSQRQHLAAKNERDGTAFKMRNDSRITRLGKWLRKYHFDELPQLWNVLIGDMSLVGPRPLPVSEAHGNEWWQRRRLTMPPGLTCLWQLADDPKIPFLEWMRLDMAYIDRWSIWLDFKVMIRTVATVIRGNGW